MTTSATASQLPAMPGPRPDHERLPALDGIRGMAVLLVMLFHFRAIRHEGGTPLLDTLYRTLSDAGWVGVDLFFVLSGFLITGILYDAKGGPRYFSTFYMRRVLRIFPLYYAYLAAVLVLLPRLARDVPPHLQYAIDHQIYYWTYLQTLLRGRSDPTLYLGHLWSLAIEEQFYVVWPLVVFLCRRATLIRIGCGVLIASLLWRIAVHLWSLPAEWMYTVTPARLDALAAGALLALVLRGSNGFQVVSRAARPLSIVCGAGLLLLWWRLESFTTESVPIGTIGLSLLDGFFAGLIALAVTLPAERRLPRFFSHPVMTFFGRYSYAMYVFQNPVLQVLVTAGLTTVAIPALWGSRLPAQVVVLAAGIGVTTALALLSWYCWEKHFLALKQFFPYGDRRVGTMPAPRREPAGPSPSASL